MARDNKGEREKKRGREGEGEQGRQRRTDKDEATGGRERCVSERDRRKEGK